MYDVRGGQQGEREEGEHSICNVFIVYCVFRLNANFSFHCWALSNANFQCNLKYVWVKVT